MPCGGIAQILPEDCPCFYCNSSKPQPDHEVIEWDAVIHGSCIAPFMQTGEGRIVYDHGHHIYACIDGITFIVRTHERNCRRCHKMFKPSLDKVVEYVNKRKDLDPAICEECT